MNVNHRKQVDSISHTNLTAKHFVRNKTGRTLSLEDKLENWHVWAGSIEKKKKKKSYSFVCRQENICKTCSNPVYYNICTHSENMLRPIHDVITIKYQ